MTTATENASSAGSVGDDGSPGWNLPEPIFHLDPDWYQKASANEKGKAWEPWIRKILMTPKKDLERQLTAEVLNQLEKGPVDSLLYLITNPQLPQDVLRSSLQSKLIQTAAQERALRQIGSGMEGSLNAILTKDHFKLSSLWMTDPATQKKFRGRLSLLFKQVSTHLSGDKAKALEYMLLIKRVAVEFRISAEIVRELGNDLAAKKRDLGDKISAGIVQQEFENFVN